MKFYIAGPFFNQPQIELISAIELLMVDQNVPCFSPRRQHSGPNTKIETAERARKVFRCNVDNIDDCTHMLAIVDWLLPIDDKIEQIHYDKETGHISARPISIPDSGTVWEMGYAFARQIPIILFRTNESKLNLMLSQCSQGVITGLSQLEKFLNKGDLNFNHAPIWKGAVI